MITEEELLLTLVATRQIRADRNARLQAAEAKFGKLMEMLNQPHEIQSACGPYILPDSFHSQKAKGVIIEGVACGPKCVNDIEAHTEHEIKRLQRQYAFNIPTGKLREAKAVLREILTFESMLRKEMEQRESQWTRQGDQVVKLGPPKPEGRLA